MTPDGFNENLDLGTDSIKVNDVQNLDELLKKSDLKKETIVLGTGLKLSNQKEAFDINPKIVNRIYESGESRKIMNVENSDDELRDDRSVETQEQVISIQASTDKDWFKKSFRPDGEYFEAAKCLLNAKKLGALDKTSLDWFNLHDGNNGSLSRMVEMFDNLGGVIDKNSEDYKKEYKKFVKDIDSWTLRSDKGLFNFLLAFKRAANVYESLWDLDDTRDLTEVNLMEGALQLTNGRARKATLLLNIKGSGSSADTGLVDDEVENNDKVEKNDDPGLKSSDVLDAGLTLDSVNIDAVISKYSELKGLDENEKSDLLDVVSEINSKLLKFQEADLEENKNDAYNDLLQSYSSVIDAEIYIREFYSGDNELGSLQIKKLVDYSVDRLKFDDKLYSSTPDFQSLVLDYMTFSFSLMASPENDVGDPYLDGFDPSYFVENVKLPKSEKLNILNLLIDSCNYFLVPGISANEIQKYRKRLTVYSKMIDSIK